MDNWRPAFDASALPGADDRAGWSFAPSGQQGPVWTVLRHDDGPFPVFSSVRGEVELPPRDQLAAMTVHAVSDLLGSAGLADEVGWVTRNLAAALLLAACEIDLWEGEEWALESDGEGRAAQWAEPDGPRTPFAWLRARSSDADSVIGVYQDADVFGLAFIDGPDRRLPDAPDGELRPRTKIPLARGRIRAVDAVYDTAVPGIITPGLLTEALLHGATGTTLLIAAEAYSATDWRLHDESVIVLTDPTAADRLTWHPDRRPWRSSWEGRR